MQIEQKYIDRFMTYIEMIPFHDCWEWTGCINQSDGYGRFYIHKKPFKAHRISAFIHNIPNKDNKPFVLHSCDNRSCVNPHHLRFGTHLENLQDMHKKNRHAKGEGSGAAKLTEKKVLEIRDKYSPYKYSFGKIAKEYGVDTTVVEDIVKRKIWKHI